MTAAPVKANPQKNAPKTHEVVEVRNCRGLDEFRACIELQREVWNFTDAELVPLRLFVVAAKVGGQAIGAFEGKNLVGFALSVPGVRTGHAYLHSHMLAVKEAYRNRGLGRRMKLFQREEALSRGIELIEWTFDPLEIKNAYLNLEKLGAIARRYNINQYGITSSPLQGFLPTDRLVAEWWLRSRRVESLLTTGKRPVAQTQIKISVPAKIYDWKAADHDRAKAADVQGRNREQFLQAFADGLAVLGYDRDAVGNGTFLLGRWDEDWSYASKANYTNEN
ncbi:MAG TPA: GNAT family N-acetyltransferase [Terriglobales bacterium]|nr:GNAT family N-acetyltransferase [Terriglobales bacterium]